MSNLNAAETVVVAPKPCLRKPKTARFERSERPDEAGQTPVAPDMVSGSAQSRGQSDLKLHVQPDEEDTQVAGGPLHTTATFIFWEDGS